ncbi:hypothetical protein GCM10022238_02020 [Gordonia hankookensis]
MQEDLSIGHPLCVPWGMSTWLIVAILVTVWVTIAVVVALVVGRMLRLRDVNEKRDEQKETTSDDTRRQDRG